MARRDYRPIFSYLSVNIVCFKKKNTLSVTNDVKVTQCEIIPGPNKPVRLLLLYQLQEYRLS